MLIKTPADIESVAWEGELILPETAMLERSGSQEQVIVTLGRPEIWAAAAALEAEVGQTWTPPLGGAEFWLVRLACTLRDPHGRRQITQAAQSLYLRPINTAVPVGAYAYSLFPHRLSVEDKGEFNVKLSPDLSFAKAISFNPGEIGAKIEYRQVFPVIQSYGAGEPTAVWEFRPHAAHPLDGSQFVYAVVAVQPGADGARASVEFTVTTDTRLGPIKMGLPREAKANMGFTIRP